MPLSDLSRSWAAIGSGEHALLAAPTGSGKTLAGFRPPHILVTTPESLYLLLTAARSREFLRTVRTVIVDEIQAGC
jgi:Lhr-like helicase